MSKHGSTARPTMYLARLDIKTTVDEAKPTHVAQVMDSHNTHGWSIAALLREMSGLDGRAMFECVESSFCFQWMLATGERGGPSLVAEDGHSDSGQCGRRKDDEKNGYSVLLDIEGERAHQMCRFMWADNFGIMSHSKENMERMLRVLIEEASRWDLEPKPASLWWTSTHDAEEKVDMILGTTAGCHKFTFRREVQDSGLCNESAREIPRCRWRKNAVSKQGLLEGRSEKQKQRRSVEGEVSKTG